MDNKTRKKKVIKWFIIGIICAAVFGILYIIDSDYSFRNSLVYNVFDGNRSAYNLIIGTPLVISFLGIFLSGLMFIISLICCWVNSTPEIVQQVVEKNDPLTQLTNLYNERLLTKQEFEEKKRQLLRGSK